MTREDRWIVSLDEIQAMRWQCPQCKVCVSYRLTETVRLPRACPTCNADVVPDVNSPIGQTLRAFVESLKALRAPGAVPVSLEFLARKGD